MQEAHLSQRGRATYYWSALVSTALSVTVFKLLDVKEYRDLEIYVRGRSRSLKMVPFERLVTVSYSHSIATMAASLAVSTRCTNVTDRQTARQTPHDGIGRVYA